MMRTLCLVFPVLLIAGSPSLYAEDDPEAAQAAREEAKEDAEGSENFQNLFEGRLMLGAIQEPGEGVVGIFRCKKRTYQLKLAQPELLEKLKPHNGKSVTLMGRPRVNGKYFLAMGIQETVANPVVPLRRPRGGGL